MQQAAVLDFSALSSFLSAHQIPTTTQVMIGETHWTNYINVTGCNFFPSNAAASTVAGYDSAYAQNPSAFSPYSWVFRPWMELEDPSGKCWPYPTTTNPNSQGFNLNGTGPYTPANQ